MKPFIRITMSMACLALLLWGGVAVPAETSPAPESCEYLMKVVQAAPWPLPASLAEAEGEWITPTAPMVAGVIVPEAGSYEYSLAMETGSLPSTCGDKPCAAEEFTIIEVGGIPYRLEVDFGGN
jgi:hypothetical protein